MTASDLNNAISLANYVTAFFGGVMAAVGVWRLRTKSNRAHTEEVSSMLRGAKIVFLALAIHQGFWGLHRAAYNFGWTDLYSWLSGHSSVVTVAYFMSFYGILKVMAVWHGPSGKIKLSDTAFLGAVWLGSVAASLLR